MTCRVILPIILPDVILLTIFWCAAYILRYVCRSMYLMISSTCSFHLSIHVLSLCAPIFIYLFVCLTLCVFVSICLEHVHVSAPWVLYLSNLLFLIVWFSVCFTVFVSVRLVVCLFVALLSSSLLLLSVYPQVYVHVSLFFPLLQCFFFVFLSVSAWWLIVRLADCPFVCLPNCLLIYFAPYTSTNLHSFIIYSFIRSFIHPLIHPFVCSFIH